MLSIQEVVQALQVTERDTSFIDADTRKLMRLGYPTVGVTINSQFAFKCSSCSADSEEPVFYQVAKVNHGPLFVSQTQPSEVVTTKGIIPISELGYTPEHSSTLNHVPGLGYVCSPCYDSVDFNDAEILTECLAWV
jgi:hypothetical protein